MSITAGTIAMLKTKLVSAITGDELARTLLNLRLLETRLA
jgi:hypothetical protein